MVTIKSSSKSSFPPLLHLTYILQQSAEEALLSDAGVGLSAVRIMSVVPKAGGISQRAIAVLLKQTEANVSRQLQAMKKQGLVSIARDKKDRRQHLISLTAKGSHKLERGAKVLASQQKSLLKLLAREEVKAIERATFTLV